MVEGSAMKYITVKLTEDQAKEVVQALEWAVNDSYPKSDPTNAFLYRIIYKVNKAIVENRHQSSADLINKKLASGELKITQAKK